MADNAVSLVAFSGSTRRGSFNTQLMGAAADLAEAAGARVQRVNLADLEMPLYNADLEASDGLPTGTRLLKVILRDADGMLIASPEYNSSITPLLKNTIDWLSRKETDDEPSLLAFRGKVAGLLSASPGHLGGLRGLVHLRSILGNLGVHVVPGQRSVSRAARAFDETGALAIEADRAGVQKLVSDTIDLARRVRSG